MNEAYLVLGSNLGDKLANLDKAISLIELKSGSIISQSKVYQTAAWGNQNQSDFYNQCIKIKTSLNALELIDNLLLIEKIIGRTRGEQKWQERIIDIDILFYNNQVINEPNLKIPHPYLQDRKFVLIPLTEIAAELIHPTINKTVRDLLMECKDNLEVKAI